VVESGRKILEKTNSAQESDSLSVHSRGESGVGLERSDLFRTRVDVEANLNLDIGVICWIGHTTTPAGHVHRHFELVESKEGGICKRQRASIRSRIQANYAPLSIPRRTDYMGNQHRAINLLPLRERRAWRNRVFTVLK